MPLMFGQGNTHKKKRENKPMEQDCTQDGISLQTETVRQTPFSRSRNGYVTGNVNTPSGSVIVRMRRIDKQTKRIGGK